MGDRTLLQVTGLVKSFPLGGGFLKKPSGWVRAVDGVSFTVARGESFGLVGESGCGKTTLGRLILRLMEPTSGRVTFDGKDIFAMPRTELLQLRRRMQIIFQDPYSSLDPRMKVEAIVTEPLRATSNRTRSQRRRVAAEILEKVGLRAGDLDKYPHEFSGGQRQRIGVARALCVRPDLIVADEPVSALDVSIQAQVINLLGDLQEEMELAYVFISHDLSVVEHVCDRIAVMYLGSIMELAPTVEFIRQPRHPYTEALLKAVPFPDPHRRSEPVLLEGDVPSPVDPPTGCPFHPRCAYCFDRCRREKPSSEEIEPDHWTACWLNSGRGLEGEQT
ncbi:MAG: ATP-binding cassette domain-containing protein [Deltaproteobacteria bacterium]|nr:ATP-binding cassette domain-containing protein [Deltaproteobacteria bacterium]